MFGAKHLELGRHGEDIAVRYLSGKSWQILKRNQEIPPWEIDILARNPQGVLVFVEVKTLAFKGDDIRPEDHFDMRKLVNMHRSAISFANAHPQLIRSSGWRIDGLAIILTNNKKDVLINHYENL